MAIHPLPLVLASASASRISLLKRTGIQFEPIASAIDEQAITAATPDERIIALARAKAQAVAAALDRPSLILAADTVAVCDAKVMEKPKYKLTAVKMLKQLSGRVHTVITGWAIHNSYKNTWFTGTSATYVTFRKLTHQEIIDYVDDNPVTSWAAAYNSQLSDAITFITKVEGSLTGLNGLPLEQIVPILRNEWLNPYKNKSKARNNVSKIIEQ